MNDESDENLLDEGAADVSIYESIFKIIFGTKSLILIDSVIFLALFTFVHPTTFRKINAFGFLFNFALVGIVLYFAGHWGLNVDFSNPDAELYMPLFKPSFYRLTGVLSMGLFLHNAVISIVGKTKNQEDNVSVTKGT